MQPVGTGKSYVGKKMKNERVDNMLGIHPFEHGGLFERSQIFGLKPKWTYGLAKNS